MIKKFVVFVSKRLMHVCDKLSGFLFHACLKAKSYIAMIVLLNASTRFNHYSTVIFIKTCEYLDKKNGLI